MSENKPEEVKAAPPKPKKVKTIQQLMYQVTLRMCLDGMKVEDAIEQVATVQEWMDLFGENRVNERACQEAQIFAGRVSQAIIRVNEELRRRFQK